MLTHHIKCFDWRVGSCSNDFYCCKKYQLVLASVIDCVFKANFMQYHLLGKLLSYNLLCGIDRWQTGSLHYVHNSLRNNNHRYNTHFACAHAIMTSHEQYCP